MVMPRSLNEPVGFKPSYFTYTSPPVMALNFGEWINGVDPSLREITGVASVTGRNSR